MLCTDKDYSSVCINTRKALEESKPLPIFPRHSSDGSTIFGEHFPCLAMTKILQFYPRSRCWTKSPKKCNHLSWKIQSQIYP